LFHLESGGQLFEGNRPVAMLQMASPNFRTVERQYEMVSGRNGQYKFGLRIGFPVIEY
jgi:hypothetical protein